jgi:hypothetical protein
MKEHVVVVVMYKAENLIISLLRVLAACLQSAEVSRE